MQAQLNILYLVMVNVRPGFVGSIVGRTTVSRRCHEQIITIRHPHLPDPSADRCTSIAAVGHNNPYPMRHTGLGMPCICNILAR